MKHTFLILTAIVLLSCNQEKGSANTDAARKQFINECMASVKNNVKQGYNDTLAKQYCNCTADKVLTELSQKELVDLGFGEDPELQQRVQQMVQPCLDNYLKQAK